MISLSGYLKKTILVFSVLFVLLALLICGTSPLNTLLKNTSAAEDNIRVSSTVEYVLDNDGNLRATITQTLSTKSPVPIVIKYYTVNIPHSDISTFNVKKSNESISGNKVSNTSSIDLICDLENSVVSSNSPLKLIINFTISNYVDPTSDIGQISLPAKISDSPTESIRVLVPKDLIEINQVIGGIAEISSYDSDTLIAISNVTKNDIILLAGNQVAYQFHIKKLLTNSDVIDRSVDITLPRPHYSQIVLFDNISPLPSSSSKDGDGNLIATYIIEPNSEKLVEISGLIVLQNSPLVNKPVYPYRSNLLQNSGYWESVTETETQKVDYYLSIDSAESGMKLYQALYNYTIDRLSYKADDEGIISSARSGASNIGPNNKGATDQDYVDLLVSLLRSWDTPTRMVSGFYTNTSGDFNEGFFHKWVECWDDNQGWIVMDPVLEEVISQNMFNIDSIDHIPLLVRGNSPNSPKLTLFLEDEFNIEISSPSSVETLLPAITITQLNRSLFDDTLGISISIANIGNTPIDSITILDDNNVEVLTSNLLILPGETKNLLYEIEQNSLTQDSPGTLNLRAIIKSINGEQEVIVLNEELSIDTYWWLDPLSYAIISLILITISLIFYNIGRYTLKLRYFKK